MLDAQQAPSRTTRTEPHSEQPIQGLLYLNLLKIGIALIE